MAHASSTRFMYFSVLIFFANVLSSWQLCDDDRLYVIRTTHATGLVLDGTQPSQVRVQHYTGFRTQLWKLERGDRVGLFYIVNDYTGTVLDYNEQSSTLLRPKAGNLRQQWYFGEAGNKGKIITAAINANLDITGQNFSAGNPVGVWNDGDYPNQKWILWEKV